MPHVAALAPWSTNPKPRPEPKANPKSKTTEPKLNKAPPEYVFIITLNLLCLSFLFY